jgi:hypothetical protein
LQLHFHESEVIGMYVIVVVGAILVTTASVNTLWDRRRHGSLERHEKALAALRDLAEHPRELPPEPPPPTPTDHVHILSEPPADAAAHRRRVQKAAAARKALERRRPRDVATRPTAAHLPTMPMHAPEAPPAPPDPGKAKPPKVSADTMPVFIDPPTPPEPRVAPAPASAATPKASRTRTVPARAVVATAAALVLIAGITSVAVLAGRPSGTKHAAPPPPPTSVPTVAARTPKPTVAPAPPPPPAPVVVAAAQGDGTVTVNVPYTLTLTASGLCWVSVQSDTGQTLYEGTLQPGQQQRVSGGGPLTVRLGNTPAMQISVDGRALTLAGVAKTANVRFVPPT